ncbi:DUF58 domain-containing protein [Pseudoxanthomonas dokdonensis]|uniref:DUF58 domain-containing protein n=1 Tax=Pseudoxanthomonas dokdonensis TaxID=344882 RepID=A0A0R0CEW6_9GAMM|nr:DUF58 domain-containing protein [Pseudoxanthomonas dokdonensis]KRG68332.1 hypothetical protein ABB29_13510 [Pseudoxanthomonas dokdonensis]
MRPGPLLLPALLLWALCGLAVVLELLPLHAWQWSGLAIAALALLDGWRLLRLPSPEVERELPDALALDVERSIALSLASPSHPLRLQVFDLHPGHWWSEGLPQTHRINAGRQLTLYYRLRPGERGDAVFAGTQLRLYSPWRLWRQSRMLGTARQVRVYPDFAPLTRFALFSADQASHLVGAHLKRRRGEGTDFNQMREYRVGDSLRQIDWKATARTRKLISREYQDERNQQVVMLLDTGRRMMAREGGLAHFDQILNAALVVSYLALRQGDAVGLMASGGASRWVPPQRGAAAIDVLLRASYDLQPQPVAIDYLQAATELSLRQRRRCLVMLVTNVRDEDIEELLLAVRLLQKRHLVCVASLREVELQQALAQPVRDLTDAVHAGAVARYLQQRSDAHERLRRQGVMVIDVASKDLPAALVERYLAVKRDGLL